MSYDLVGCIEMVSGEWKPRWEHPCTGNDVYGCFKKDGGLWLPYYSGSFNNCSGPFNGCMKKVSGKWVPVIQFPSYDDLTELRSNCCYPCSLCSYDTPEYLDITFSGVTPCFSDGCGPGYSNVEYDYHNVNNTYRIPWYSGCFYYDEVTSAFRHRSWTGGQCTGDPGEWADWTTYLQVTITATQVRVEMWDYLASVPWVRNIFDGYGTPDAGTCAEVSSISNIVSCTAVWSSSPHQDSGTCQVEEIF